MTPARRRFATTGRLRAAADDGGDLPKRHPFIRNAMIPRARGIPFEREPEKICGIKPMHRRPATYAVADIR